MTRALYLLLIVVIPLAGGPALAETPTSRSSTLLSNRITAVQPFPDGLLLGTARGIFALISTDTGRMIPGLDAFVFSLAEQNGVILAGTGTGPALLRHGVIQALPVPPAWKDAAILTVAAADEFFIAGGASGLLTISAEGVVKVRTTPPDVGGVIATAATGGEILVAFEKELFAFRPRSEEWIRIDAGRAYVTLVLFADGRWFGLDRGGALFSGRIVAGESAAPAPPERIDADLDDDAALAIARHPKESALLVGTMRGRILTLRVEPGRRPTAARRILDDGAGPALPIRALAVTGTGEIIAGTDGGGVLVVSPAGAVRWITSSRDPAEVTAFAEATTQSPGARWRPLIRETSERILERVANRSSLVAIVIITILFAVLALLVAAKRRRPEERQIREKRRSSRSPLNLPSPEELTPEIGALALRFMSITNEINELSRTAAKNGAAGIAEQARRASTAFDETEEKMRVHFAGLEDLRQRHVAEIESLKERIRQATNEEKEEIRARLDVLEESLKQAEKDERYLRYVLEE